VKKIGWILIDNMLDDEEIYTGVCIRFYNTAKGLAEQCALPCGKDDPLDYVITEIYDNREYFQLTCLTEGEVGNITCVLKRENGNHFVTGKEIKRMLLTDLYKVLIHLQPKINIV
jgi:hypothetical protein